MINTITEQLITMVDSIEGSIEIMQKEKKEKAKLLKSLEKAKVVNAEVGIDTTAIGEKVQITFNEITSIETEIPKMKRVLNRLKTSIDIMLGDDIEIEQTESVIEQVS